MYIPDIPRAARLCLSICSVKGRKGAKEVGNKAEKEMTLQCSSKTNMNSTCITGSALLLYLEGTTFIFLDTYKDYMNV